MALPAWMSTEPSAQTPGALDCPRPGTVRTGGEISVLEERKEPRSWANLPPRPPGTQLHQTVRLEVATLAIGSFLLVTPRPAHLPWRKWGSVCKAGGQREAAHRERRVTFLRQQAGGDVMEKVVIATYLG